MLLKKSIQKTKKFILKTLQNMKNMLFGSYDSIPRTLFLNPLSCTSINQSNNHNLDIIYPRFSNRTTNIEHSMKQNVISEDGHRNALNSSSETRHKIEPKSAQSSSCRYANDGTYVLAQKMKELDMIEVGDVDHALDVEEALTYYSRLSCPVYVDIVDKFFMDMYEEFLLPQASVSLSSSSRRLGPLKL
ncbi:hypothetical protein RND81_09G117900 [Saponaria officinalis]|uniref:Uncharacterized protein n=1 Tax=Saponaria officinalis TaxID=3572 RepID=A0AAW1IJJ0_SAPOF